MLSWLNLQNIINHFLGLFGSTLVTSFIFNSNLLGDVFLLKIKKKIFLFFFSLFLLKVLLFPLLTLQAIFLIFKLCLTQ